MNNEQINKSIAVLRGWRFVDDDPNYEPYWEDPNGTKIAVNFIDYRVPNYAGCLNAMHEAEKVLTDDQHEDYTEYLEIVVGITWGTSHSYHMKNLRSATARQRAEAFLRTIGKWEDEA